MKLLKKMLSPQGLQMDREMVIDATMFLWQKCKVGILKILVSGNNYLKTARKYQTSKVIFYCKCMLRRVKLHVICPLNYSIF